MQILWMLALRDLIGGVDHWQTLIAGFFAIGAALIGGQYILRQIDEARLEGNESRSRKFKALRAVLPLTLSYIMVYLRDSGTALKQIYKQKEDQVIPGTIELPTFPVLPKDVVSQLQEIVETGSEEVGDLVSDMLAKIQVQSARVESLISWRRHPDSTLITTTNIERYIIDTAEIYCIASGMFDFARRKSNVVCNETTQDGLASALNQLGFWSEDYPSVHNLMRETT